MEGSNAGAEAVGTNNESAHPVTSPVPDLVTGVPAATTSAVNDTTTNSSDPPARSDPPGTCTKVSGTTSPGTIQTSPAVAAKSVSTATQPNNASPRATSLPSAASEASVKNRSSREEKTRKKEDKSVDHVLRALNSLNTTEEKLAAMCKKYTDIFDEHRKLQLLHKQTEKRCSMLQREKEQLQAEHSKAILTRSRLENLCRELQRQNKAIKDESLLKIREEEEKRKEVSAKFQTTMNEITTLMQQNNDKNMKLRDDNIDMTTKLKNICEQYELRQQQVERISKQMQLEQQLADAKLSKLKMEMAAEREILLREKQQLLLELQQYQQRCTEFQATELNLRSQISMYNDKYDEFQKALARSNDVFGGFKGEMEKMSKKICKLEKETSSWKQRWERSHNALLEMAADKQKSEQELAVVSRQLATLQNLCRTLQTERSTLLSKLKIFQGGGHEPLENSVGSQADNCNKQCDQPVKHVENDTVLDNYTKDILASFKEGVSAADSPSIGSTAATTDSATTACAETLVPVTANPLPDVVEATNSSVLDQKRDVNSALCQRLENISLELSSSLIEENVSSDNSVIIQPNLETNVSVIQENLNVAPSYTNATSNHQSVIVENLNHHVLLNGDVHLNGSPPADLSPQQEQPPLNASQPQPPKSPTTKSSPAKSTDSGKKTKEMTKKKKK